MQPDPSQNPPTAQTGDGGGGSAQPTDWLALAQAAFNSSTTYFEANYRKSINDSIRAFNNQHPMDSKYVQPSYDKRSHLYRPKMRTVIRKNEAAIAAAFFSNLDVIATQALDPSNPAEQVSAEIMKEILKYRLEKSIPWFQIICGGLQDAQTTGVVCAHIHWEYEEEDEPTQAPLVTESGEEEESLPTGALKLGVEHQTPAQQEQAPVLGVTVESAQPRIVKDKPTIDLIPVENIRIDPAANWMDPINSSPYVIHLIPMYVQDVKGYMHSGEWMTYADGVIVSAIDGNASESTQTARNPGRENPYNSSTREVQDYEIVWVQRHIHRRNNCEYEFYTLGTQALLTEPRPLKETVFHGKRPYVMGNCVIETHKVMPSSIPTLGRGLSDESNEIVNQRSDNVKFVLNKKFIVKRGKESDVAGLVRNVPGGVVTMDDPQGDVRELTWPDVTQSAYEEQNRVDRDIDELLGNFNPASLMALTGSGNQPARNMAMLGQSQGTMTEYAIRTYVETFVAPVLRQLVLLEQEYETDQVILALAAKKSKGFQKLGIDRVTDDLLMAELTISVNVGMGATDPMMKLQKFLGGIQAYVGMLRYSPQGMNMPEVGKEIFGYLGYGDATRFFTSDDPGKQMMQQQIQQLMKAVQELQGKLKEKQTGHMVNLRKADIAAGAKLEATKIHEQHEDRRNVATHIRALAENSNKMQLGMMAHAAKAAAPVRAVK